MPRVSPRPIVSLRANRWSSCARALLLLTMLVPAALGGLPFFWCGPMAQLRMHCCCPNSHLHPHADLAAVDDASPVCTESRRACCESRQISSLPPASGAHAPAHEVGAPAAVAHLGALFFSPPRAASRHAGRFGLDRNARAGPEPPSLDSLQVYRL